MIVTAALPSASSADQTKLYRLTTDNKVYFSDGSSWYSQGIGNISTYVNSADFSWINQGSATVAQTSGGLYMTAPSNGSAQNFRMQVKTLPAAPYTLTVALYPIYWYLQFCDMVFGLRESSSGKLVVVRIGLNGAALFFEYSKWDSPSASNSSYIGLQAAGVVQKMPMYIRIQDNNTNRILYMGTSAQDFVQIHSVTRTDFITPDQAYWGLNPFSQVAGVTLASWTETA